MPQTVDIPGQGVAEFPDEMTPDQIKGVIHDKFFSQPAPQTFAPGSPREIAREQLASQPVVQQQMERAGRAVADTAVGFVKGLPSMAKFIAPPTLTDVLTGAAETLGQVKQVQTSPVGSQEWWNAVVPLAGQVAMEVGALRVGAPKLTESLFGKEKPPVQPLAAETAATKEVIKNASQIPSTERVPSAQVRPGVDEKAPLRQQGQAPEVREKAQVGTQVTPVPQPEQPRIISTAVQTPEGIKTGTFNQPHEEIVKGASEEQKGFMVRDADGTERFVGREEAAGVAKAADQVKPENAGTTELHSQQLAAAVSGTEMPPAAVPQIPEGAKATVKLRTETGEMAEATMDAKQAEGIFTKEKSSYQALLNCLGA